MNGGMTASGREVLGEPRLPGHMAETRLRDGRYVIVGELGEAAQGTTFDGVDVKEGRPVAIGSNSTCSEFVRSERECDGPNSRYTIQSADSGG
jgi:hypothetical protein